MILINFLLAIVLVDLAICLGGVDKLLVFWDTPSVLIVGFIVLILASASGKWSLFIRGLKETVSMKPTEYCAEAKQIASLYRYLFRGNMLGGVLGAIIGLVLMLADLDPDKIGSGMAVSLLTVYYAVFISLFLLLPISERFAQCAENNE